MEGGDIVVSIVSAVIAGLVSSLGTVKALGVHITYLREQQAENKKAIERAHERIDEHIRIHHSNTNRN